MAHERLVLAQWASRNTGRMVPRLVRARPCPPTLVLLAIDPMARNAGAIVVLPYPLAVPLAIQVWPL